MLTVEKPLEFVAIPEEVSDQYVGSNPTWALEDVEGKEGYRALSYAEGLAKEPIIQRFDENNWVTVNRYGARCLNSRTLFMADIDFKGFSMWCKLPSLSKDLSNERRAIYLGNELIGRCYAELSDKAYWEGLRFEIYITYGGIRVLETSQEYYLPGFSGWLWGHFPGDTEKDLKARQKYFQLFNKGVETDYPYPYHPTGVDLLCELSNDGRYRDLCLQQQCYRHRLDPKPWRQEDNVALRHVVIGTAERNPALAPLLEAYDRQVLGE